MISLIHNATRPMRTPTLALAGALFLAAPALAGTEPASDAAYAITADRVVVDGATVIPDGLVLVDGGRILAVGTEADLLGTLADGVRVVDHEGWLTAGIVAANGNFGIASRVDDSTRAFVQDLELVDAFDPEHHSLRAVAEAGVTAYGLTAGRSNVAGGIGAVVRTDGTVLDADASLALCLAPPALRGNRFPTSYAGAVHAVEERFASSEGAFGRAAAGELSLEIAVGARHEIRRTLDLLERLGRPATLRGADRAGEFTEDLVATGSSVALSAPGLSAAAWRFDSIRDLIRAEVPFAFGLADTSRGADCLRFGAALAVDRGLDRGSLWNALTVHPAAMLGAGDRIGRVASGYDADLCLWSGDPLALTTTLEAVYLGGNLLQDEEGDQE